MKKAIVVGVVALAMITVACLAGRTKVETNVEQINPVFTAHVPPQCAELAMEMTGGQQKVVMKAEQFRIFETRMNECFAQAHLGSIQEGTK